MLKQILKKKKRPIVVSDFDGTISTRDISYEILDRFSTGGWQGVDEAYARGEIGSQEAFRLILEKIKATKSELIDHINQLSPPIDPRFVEFYRYIRERGIDLVILSDGFLFYIKLLLEREGITDIPIYANDIIEDKTGTLVPIFPYHNGQCDKCGNCKSNIVKKLKEDHDHIIFVGDGYSDLCASELADTLFAKRQLMKHAAETRRPFTYFHDFADVRTEFEKEIRGVIFDLDGTLVDSLEAIRTSFLHTIDTLDLDVDVEKSFGEMMNWPLTVGMEKIFPGTDLNEAVKVFREKYYAIYKDATPIKPGINEVLTYLADSGVKLTVATNKLAPLARELLEHLAIDGYFEAVIGVGDVPNPKPAPDMVDAAIQKMGTTRQDTILVGDSQVDIETARNSNIDVYVVSDSFDPPEELVKRKPRKMFYSTEELGRELSSEV
ncbi:MAG: HAD family hydrolase [Deltaproteobacteria bacterium]|nr:HAD family hydrolase [Candidatus Zymogenaceae bacterium]